MSNIELKSAIELRDHRDMVEAIQEAWVETFPADAPVDKKMHMALKMLLAMMAHSCMELGADEAALEVMWLSHFMDTRTTIIGVLDDTNVIDFASHVQNSSGLVH